MSKAVAEIAAGAGLIALDIFTLGAATPAAIALLSAGASLIMSGIGTLLSTQHKGIADNMLNPVAPWNVVYGRARVGGTTIWQQTNGDTDKYWHRVIVLNCHRSQSVDAVLFDNKRVCLDTNGNSISFGDSTSVTASQQTVNIVSITRANDVVTVVMANAMPLPASTAAGPALMDADTVQIQNVSTDQTLNGQYQIQIVDSTTFTYICGGNPVSITGEGSVKTQWPDYGDTVHLEVALGTQGPGNPPFPGLLATDGTGSGGTWTAQHLAQGRTAVYLRMKYGGNTYQSGLPTLGFLLHGKNDIYDPRTGATGYTENAALCIADFLCQQTWGYKCTYGSDVPFGPLIAGANICDEGVTLASGGTEPRYTCNGSFQLDAKRGEILQNLLTSCGGRLTYNGGQFVVNPAAWTGATVQMGTATPTNSAGSALTAATLVVWASWTPDSTGYGSPNIAVHVGGSSTHTFDLSGLTTTPSAVSYALSTSDLGTIFQMSLVSSIQGTTGGADFTSHPAYLKIYDCYFEATFADGSTETVRPTSTYQLSGDGYGIFYNGTQGVITNAANAIDADANPPVTYAQIMRDYFGSLSNAGYLQLSTFSFPVNNSVTPTAITPLTYAAGPFQWKPKVAVRDLYNGVKATYVSPANNWQPSDMPPYAQDADHGYASDANLAADGNERRWLDMQFPFTISAPTGQRLAKIALLRSRQQGAGTFAFNLAMYQLTALDVVEFSLPPLAWTNKLLEVTAHRFTVNKQQNEKSDDSIVLGTELDLQETDPSVYSWDASEELTAQGYQQPSLVGTQSISAPASVTATNSTVVGNGITQGQVQISWSAPADGFVSNGGQVIVQYSLDDATWQALGTYDASTTTAYIPNVSAGQQYWARVAYVNVAGVQSGWTTFGPIAATGSSLNLPRADGETPSGSIDGTNTVFTLAHPPSAAASLLLFLDNTLLIQGLDYTLSGSTITFENYIPQGGDTLRAWYWY